MVSLGGCDLLGDGFFGAFVASSFAALTVELVEVDAVGLVGDQQVEHRAVFTGLASGTYLVSGLGLGGRHPGHPGTNVPFSSDRGSGALAEPRLATTDWATSPAVATTTVTAQ